MFPRRPPSAAPRAGPGLGWAGLSQPGQGSQLRAKGEETIPQAGAILGLKHHAESTRPEFKVKLHPSFLAE